MREERRGPYSDGVVYESTSPSAPSSNVAMKINIKTPVILNHSSSSFPHDISKLPDVLNGADYVVSSLQHTWRIHSETDPIGGTRQDHIPRPKSETL